MRVKGLVLCALYLLFLTPLVAQAQDFKKWETAIKEYKQWLDLVKSDQYKYWTKLDSTRRPIKLYVGAGFHRAEAQDQEQFVDVFSRYLAGHPEKFALIDIFDSGTGSHIGEFGWGGFKLYPNSDAARARNAKAGK
ncbi:MAG: hypothetical protein A3F90_18565 [Deltaproteobacteria bacterium RIFCSPLOWO2_12_FULL_60_19]|nr:MAG: hypothetical protein A3F90_18565 [Deltaproteobacteria bacterium RIFCSPLOWO2_12_FULL_60_19]